MEPTEKPQHIQFLEHAIKEFSQHQHVEYILIANIKTTGQTAMRPSNGDFGWIFGQMKIATEWFTGKFRLMQEGTMRAELAQQMSVYAAMQVDPGGKAN